MRRLDENINIKPNTNARTQIINKKLAATM